ncbi:MAG: SHOCT domain-containing protein [bacterium]
MHGWGLWGMGGWMWLFWIIVLGAVVWGVLAALRGGERPGGMGTGTEDVRTPLEILKERYARGEIDREEFEERKEALEED